MKTLIDHVTVLTMDEQDRVLQDGYVLIEGNRIVSLGEGDRPAAYDRYLDGRQGILMPGMINTHCHIPMIPFRTMGDDCEDRLRRFLFPLELEAMTPELVYHASRYAVCEMLLAGVTTVLDMYYFEEQVGAACRELGIRGFLGQTVMEAPTCDSKEAYGGLKLAEELLDKWSGDDRIQLVVAPHAPYTNSGEMLKKAYDLSVKYGALFTLHASEMDHEMKYFREQFGQTPIEYLNDLGILGPNTVAAHCIHMTEYDLSIMKHNGSRIAHCIGSNMKAGKGAAPVKAMLDYGIPVGLGTDGASSGNTLDLFAQFKMCAGGQKSRYHDRGVFPAKDIVRLGTLGGARVLGIERETGSIETGKQADLVLVETRSVNMFPVYNPYSALVYSANAANVETVFAGGEMVVHEKKLTQVDFAEIKHQLSEAMKPFYVHAQKYASMI